MKRIQVDRTSHKAFLNNKLELSDLKLKLLLGYYLFDYNMRPLDKNSWKIEIKNIKPFLENISTIDWKIFFDYLPDNYKTLDDFYEFYYNNKDIDLTDIGALCYNNKLNPYDIIREIDNLTTLINYLPFYNSNPEFGVVKVDSLKILITFLMNKISTLSSFPDIYPELLPINPIEKVFSYLNNKGIKR